MNILEIRLSNESYSKSIYIESDEEASNAYSSLCEAMHSDQITSIVINEVPHTLRGNSIIGVALTTSEVMQKKEAAHQLKIQAEISRQSQFQLQSSAGIANAVCDSRYSNGII